MKKYLRELYKRRDLLVCLVSCDLKAQHRNTMLGYFWWLLDPLFGVLIYYFVVVVVFRRGGVDYGIFLAVGMIVWRWLSSTVTLASTSIITQAGIITQVYLPKLIFPLGATLTHLFHFGFGLLAVAALLAVFGVFPGSAWLWLPYITLMQFLFLSALAGIFAFACVFVRDIDNLVQHLMRIWFFGSPVIWHEEMVPENVRWLLTINPMTHFLGGYRDIFMHGIRPDYRPLLSIGVISALAIGLLTYYYSRREHEIVKIL
jgi:lipopolysaccharide transport system permease protein/teichoic acid transport system permease protein